MTPRARRLALRVGVPAVAVAGLIAYTLAHQELALFGDVLRLLLVVSLGCALVGTWLVLRRMAMMSDAIGHSILLGIVVMFFFVQDPGSPLFVIGAALSGLLTVVLTEALLATRLVREDASIGMVFSFLFALALVLLGLFFREAHVDQHLVLAGGVEVTVLNQVVIESLKLPGWLSATLGGVIQGSLPPEAVTVTPDRAMTLHDLRLGPRAMWTMGGIVLVEVAFLALLWKELKLATFDPSLAASLGFAPVALNYGLMSLVAVTAVGSFEAVGSILVIALFVTPPATAYLLTRDLAEFTGLSLVIAGFDTWLGFVVGQQLNTNFGGSVAFMAGVVFAVVLLFAPEEGLVIQGFRRAAKRREFAVDLLLVHLSHHAGTEAEAEESSLDTLPEHLRWTDERTRTVTSRALRNGLVARTNGRLELTPAGQSRAELALLRGRNQEPATT